MKFDIHKILNELTSIKTSTYIILISFVSVFNLWYLAICFLKPDFIRQYDLITTLQLTLAFSITWLIISAHNAPKLMILNLILFSKSDLELIINNLIDDECWKKNVNKLTLINSSLSLSFFVFIGVLFGFSLKTLVISSFSIQLIFLVLYEILIIVEAEKMGKNK